MKNKLVYVELKSGGGNCRLAWIGIAGASKTGATIYSNAKAFKSLKGSGIEGNYFDIESGEEYWISGIKKNNQDRHWVGGGDILIDQSAIKLYLKETGFASLPSNMIPSTLAPAKQQSSHSNLEHQSFGERSKEYLDTINWGRGGAIKRKF
ncbi:MAG: hypothetical protein COC12_14045 [Rhodobacteraceae bacterium]|nr:MAG: hypothetical protein COC12_14045 [Paracoccaceae bacterium]